MVENDNEDFLSFLSDIIAKALEQDLKIVLITDSENIRSELSREGFKNLTFKRPTEESANKPANKPVLAEN